MPKTILAAIPQNLRGRGHTRCVPMQCSCGIPMLYGLSNGSEDEIGKFDQIDIRCPCCAEVTSEPVAPLLDPKNIHNGQSGRPETNGVVG